MFRNIIFDRLVDVQGRERGDLTLQKFNAAVKEYCLLLVGYRFMFYNWLFLLVVPGALILFYILMISDVALANKFGGLSNSVSFAITLFTYIYVVLTGAMVRQMIKNQDEQMRPYITADLDYVNGTLYLIIQNIGQRAAHDVSFAFEPELVARGGRNYSQSHFKEAFSFIPPKKMIKYFINWGDELAKGKIPLEYNVTIAYSYQKTQKAEEKYRLDLSPYLGMLYHRTADLNVVVKSLNEIQGSLKSLADRGLYVKTTRDIKREQQEEEEFYAGIEQKESNIEDVL